MSLHSTSRFFTPLSGIILYLTMGLANVILLTSQPWDCWVIQRWALLFCIYILVRISKSSISWLGLIYGLGVIQALCVALQCCYIIPSNHGLFLVTGFMNNPGPLGGFQAVCLVVGVLLSKQQKHGIYRNLIWFGLVLIGFSIFLADSRAGWLAVVIGSMWIYRTELIDYGRKHKNLIITICGAVIILILWLITYRFASVQARLLIWRVSLDMILDKPLLGHGIGQFAFQYMHYQGAYFEHYPSSIFLSVADNVSHPYNELLHLLVEQGIVGVVIFSILIITIWRSVINKDFLAPLIALLVFGMFSYPSRVWMLMLLVPILIAVLPCRDRINLIINKKIITALSLALAIGILYHQIIIYSHATVMQDAYNKSSATYLQQHFSRYYQSPYYNGKYLMWALNYPEFNIDFGEGTTIPNSERWCAIGDYYIGHGAIQSAYDYYSQANKMLPTRIMPNYKMWELCIKYHYDSLAYVHAQRILSQPIKIENTYTIQKRYIIEQFYKNTKANHQEH